MKRPQASIRSTTTVRKRRASDGGHWSEATAREILAGWDPRQQALGDYARSLGEQPGRLAYWVAKFASDQAPAPMGFLPVVVKAPTLSAPQPVAPTRALQRDFEIVLHTGRRVMVPADFEPGALMRLVQALETVSPC
jgi:hypothetical protein